MYNCCFICRAERGSGFAELCFLVLVILGSFLFGLLVATCFILAMKAKHYLQDKKMREEITQLEADKKRLEEQIAMLQHTQMLHEASAERKAAGADSAKESAAVK